MSLLNWTEKKWTKKKENLGDGLVSRSESSLENPLIKVVAQKEGRVHGLVMIPFWNRTNILGER